VARKEVTRDILAQGVLTVGLGCRQETSMGAGDWVTGGLRRAVSGVKSAMPGQGEPESAEESGAVLVDADADAASPTPPPVPRTSAKKAPAKTSARAKAAPVKAAPKTSETRAATKAPVPAQPVPEESPADEPASLPVPTWTGAELDGFRAALEDDIMRLREELNMGAADMADLLADSGDGAGDDQADAGSKTLEREQEMSVNANARDLLEQSTHALRRLEAGTYGICESCGSVIPAARLRAFPRATLCIACKQAEERR
jgi:RNA polymerase-binding protein DksA